MLPKTCCALASVPKHTSRAQFAGTNHIFSLEAGRQCLGTARRERAKRSTLQLTPVWASVTDFVEITSEKPLGYVAQGAAPPSRNAAYGQGPCKRFQRQFILSCKFQRYRKIAIVTRWKWASGARSSK